MRSEEFYRNQFKSWYPTLRKIVYSQRFDDILTLVSDKYKIHNVTPKKGGIFSPFRYCNIKNLQLVILAEKPIISSNCNGLALTDDDEKVIMTKQTEQIWRSIENDYYDGLLMEPDIDKIYWAKQGILLLNSILTTDMVNPDFHKELWQPFTKAIIKIMAKNRIPILLWGKNVFEYENLIKPYSNKYMKTLTPYEDNNWNFSFKKLTEKFNLKINWK